MLYNFIRRGCVFLALAALAIFFFQSSLMAKELILNRTGTIRVTKPDGVVLVIEPDQALPDIPSGSKVEVLNGSIEIEPSEGFIQLVLGGSVATVKAGDNVTASIDEKTAIPDFKVKTGRVNIITGNTATTLGVGQYAQVSLDKVTGITTVKSIAGAIETVTVGVKAVIPEGAIAKIRADAKTRNVYIESVEGAVTVTSIEGKVIILAKAESTDIEGSAEGEIQTFAEEAAMPFVPTEEPVEPERPEASPHRP